MHTSELLSTFTAAAALGVVLFAVARSLKVSAIVVLLIGGVLAGPQVLGIVRPDVLGDGLSVIISLAVAIILFEGGLTLDLGGYRSASKEIFRILTIGVLITWIGGTALIWGLFGFDLPFCLLGASLVIVTGPTVIGPLLHRIRVKTRLHHILHWEGVLIDPIGVFITLACFEFYVSTDASSQLIAADFFTRLLTGIILGLAFGFILDLVVKKEWIPEGNLNIFVLAMAMLNFGIADLFIAESGLLSVTVAGLVLGSRKTPQLRSIVSYKTELKDFLIGLLFVLLAANLDLASFLDYGWKTFAVTVGLMLIIRPLNVFASMRGTDLSTNEKLFLSWIAPRGIVAASMASIFTLELKKEDVADAAFLETFTYSVIAGTVLVQGLTAGIVGNVLGVLQPAANGWVIVGANPVGRSVASFLSRVGIPVVVFDSNARDIRAAKREGLIALNEDAMQMDVDNHPEVYDCGNFLAITPNVDLNRMLCHRWSELVEGSVYRWEPEGSETDENRHLLSGKKIWDKLPLNRWMRPDRDSAPFIPYKGTKVPQESEILLTFRNGQVIVGQSNADDHEGETWLVYQPVLHRADSHFPLIQQNVIFSDEQNLRSLYGEMIDRLQDMNPDLESEALLDEMWTREEEYTSLLGHGIALPHIRSELIDQAIMVVARPSKKLICPLTDAEIGIIFMLISPANNPDEHLENLSHLASLVGTSAKREKLMRASSEEELYELIEAG